MSDEPDDDDAGDDLVDAAEADDVDRDAFRADVEDLMRKRGFRGDPGKLLAVPAPKPAPGPGPQSRAAATPTPAVTPTPAPSAPKKPVHRDGIPGKI